MNAIFCTSSGRRAGLDISEFKLKRSDMFRNIYWINLGKYPFFYVDKMSKDRKKAILISVDPIGGGSGPGRRYTKEEDSRKLVEDIARRQGLTTVWEDVGQAFGAYQTVEDLVSLAYPEVKDNRELDLLGAIDLPPGTSPNDVRDSEYATHRYRIHDTPVTSFDKQETAYILAHPVHSRNKLVIEQDGPDTVIQFIDASISNLAAELDADLGESVLKLIL